MAVVNLAVFIHGMIPDKNPSDTTVEFRTFWSDLCAFKPELQSLFPADQVVFVAWGQQPESAASRLRPDQKLTKAEQNVSELVQYDNVKQRPSENNVLMTGLFGRDYGMPGLRGILVNLREEIVQFGLADVIYYCSTDGEAQVRKVVYGDVLNALRKFQDAEEVRLHVVGHSLGVTVSHDFLFGLFRAGHESDYLQQAEKDHQEQYRFWRKRAEEGTLKVGSFTSMASQLPLFVMRKHAMIDIFQSPEGRLNLDDIGIVEPGVRWQIFYDVDDILGFASRDLYNDPEGHIRQVQVNTGFKDDAHTDYTKNSDVIKSTAELMLKNGL